jgi:hypothetical protein
MRKAQSHQQPTITMLLKTTFYLSFLVALVAASPVAQGDGKNVCSSAPHVKINVS